MILENFLEPYLFNGQVTRRGMQVASLYVDQVGADDMSRDVAKQFNIPIYPTIAEALCLGGDKLAVDAVLLIGEHGNYPINDKAQMQYPRKQFFDQIVAVFKTQRPRGAGVLRQAPVVSLGLGQGDGRHVARDEVSADGRQLGAAGRAPAAAGIARGRQDRRRRFRSTAAASRATTSTRWRCLQSMVEARAGGETGVRAGAIPRRPSRCGKRPTPGCGRPTWRPRRWPPKSVPSTS